jgi:hypothetical protein
MDALADNNQQSGEGRLVMAADNARDLAIGTATLTDGRAASV